MHKAQLVLRELLVLRERRACKVLKVLLALKVQ